MGAGIAGEPTRTLRDWEAVTLSGGYGACARNVSLTAPPPREKIPRQSPIPGKTVRNA